MSRVRAYEAAFRDPCLSLVATALLAAMVSPALAGDDVAVRLRVQGRSDLATLWESAKSVEERGRGLERDHPGEAVHAYLGVARSFEHVAEQRPLLAEAWWRGARGYWLAADTLPVEQTTQRLLHFERAESMSTRGIEADFECAECMLWKFAAMGRLRTSRGVWSSISQLDDMAALLDDAIALEPIQADDDQNSTLGNLHYSSAIFYRVFPDWFWIGWVLGVRGDKERALRHIETALALHPTRLDYRIELGAQLLCLGSTRSDPERLQEGTQLLKEAITREPETHGDARDIAAARIMLREPRRSCGYSGDAWIEIGRDQALRAAKRAEAPL